MKLSLGEDFANKIINHPLGSNRGHLKGSQHLSEEPYFYRNCVIFDKVMLRSMNKTTKSGFELRDRELLLDYPVTVIIL